MSRQQEIQYLEERLAELRRQTDGEKRSAVGALRPTTEADEEAPPVPHRLPTPSPSARRTNPKKRKAPSRADIQRMERAVIALVVVFFGSCVALAAVGPEEAADKPAASSDAEERPEQTSRGSAPAGRQPRSEPVPSGPNPMAICERLVKAGAAAGCESKESLQEGVRIAEFTLAHGEGDAGAVRTFDLVARCQDSSAGLLSGGARFERCDLRTTVHLPAGASAEDASAARRVVTSL